jgi:hypothetical protein
MRNKIILMSFFLIFFLVGCSNLRTSKNEINNSTSIITNNPINTNLNNTKIVNSLSGYLIFKTKSCAFRITDPPYLPETPCAPDSGYIILSESKDELKTNPLKEKTILNKNQILVYSVPDSVIDRIEFGNIYNFKGSVKKYNDIISIKYLGIKDIIDCKGLENEIITLINKANHCNVDSDCIYKPNLGFNKGCDRIFNKNEDLTTVKLKEKVFSDFKCSFPEVTCLSPDRINLKCEENKCVSVQTN